MHKTLYNISRGRGKCPPYPCLRASMTKGEVKKFKFHEKRQNFTPFCTESSFAGKQWHAPVISEVTESSVFLIKNYSYCEHTVAGTVTHAEWCTSLYCETTTNKDPISPVWKMWSVFIFAKTIIKQTSFPADNIETKASLLVADNICKHKEKRSVQHTNCVMCMILYVHRRQYCVAVIKRNWCGTCTC